MDRTHDHRIPNATFFLWTTPRYMVGRDGLEPSAPRSSIWRSTNWATLPCGTRRTSRTHYQLVWSQSLVLLRLRFIWYMEPHPSASLGSAAWKAAVLDGLLMRHIGVDDGVRSHNLCVGNAMLYQLSYIHIWWNWWDLNPRPLRCKQSALPTELQPHIW